MFCFYLSGDDMYSFERGEKKEVYALLGKASKYN
jgi:hypothetical protein